MSGTLYCVVDADGNVFARDDMGSYAEVAAAFGVNQETCQEYRYDLATRRLISDRAAPSSDTAVRAFVSQRLGTPEGLMKFAEEGNLSKASLASLLKIEDRQSYLDACGKLEKAYTDACRAENDPCLETGCSAEDEICLQPLLRAGVDYYKACGAEWVRLFRTPTNRIDAWKN